MGTSPPRPSRLLGAREAAGTKEGSLLSFRAPRGGLSALRPASPHSLKGEGTQFLPGKAAPHSDFLSMATSPGCSGPLLRLEPATGRGCSLGSMPTLLWGLTLLVAPPQAPGSQLLVPLLKGLEPGGEGEVLQLPPGPVLFVPSSFSPSLCPRRAGSRRCPRPNAEAQSRSRTDL